MFWDNRHSGQSCGVVRHKDQKNPRAHTDADSGAKTPEALSEKINAQSIALGFAETEAGLGDSISELDAEDEVKPQKSVSYSHTNCISIGNSDSRENPNPESNRNFETNSDAFPVRASCSRKKRRAQRDPFAW